jgi:cytochrome P450
LRLRVPLFAIGRRAQRDYPLGRFTIPEGMGIAVPLLVVFRSPKLFKEPTRFRPERYIAGETPSWVPFGTGIRDCIGRDFAPLQIKLLLRGILDRFDLAVLHARPERVELMSGALLVPHGREVPLRVTVQHESPARA